MSVGTIWVIANWLIELDFKEKWIRLKKNKIVWLALSLFLIHVVGLLWTEDWSYGLRDVEKKLPLLVIPFVCGTREYVKKAHLWVILYGFLASLIITTVINFSVSYMNGEIVDCRDISNH